MIDPKLLSPIKPATFKSPKTALIALGLTAAGLTTGVMAAPHMDLPKLFNTQAQAIEANDVAQALKLRLPKTKIDKVDCGLVTGLCEVNAGSTLFYVDRTARYLFVGRLYDMETRADLTAARLLELNPDLIAAGGAKMAKRSEDGTEAAPAAKPKRVSLGNLRPDGVIYWGPKDGPRVIVLSDFNCSYCQKLERELTTLGARVEERPISIFGAKSRVIADAVYCSANQPRALKAAYNGLALPKQRSCDTSGLDANEAFAKTHGFSGTPVIIRPDGTVLEGYRPASVIAAFLKAGAGPASAAPAAKGN